MSDKFICSNCGKEMYLKVLESVVGQPKCPDCGAPMYREK